MNVFSILVESEVNSSFNNCDIYWYFPLQEHIELCSFCKRFDDVEVHLTCSDFNFIFKEYFCDF